MASVIEATKELKARLDQIVVNYASLEVNKEDAAVQAGAVFDDVKFAGLPAEVLEPVKESFTIDMNNAHVTRQELLAKIRKPHIGRREEPINVDSEPGPSGLKFTAGSNGTDKGVAMTASEIQAQMAKINKRISDLRTLKVPEMSTDAAWRAWLTKNQIDSIEEVICVPGLEDAIATTFPGKADPGIAGPIANHFKARERTGTTEGKDFTTKQVIINNALRDLCRAVLGRIITSYTFMWFADYIVNMFGVTNIKANSFKEQYAVYETKSLIDPTIYRKLLSRQSKTNGAPLVDEKVEMKFDDILYFLTVNGAGESSLAKTTLKDLAVNMETTLNSVGRTKPSVAAFFKDICFKLEYCKAMNQMVFPNKKTRNGEGGTVKFAISDPTFTFGMYNSKGMSTFLTAAHFGSGALAAGLLSWYAGENKKGKGREVLAQKAYQQRLQELKIRIGNEAYNHVFDAAGAPKTNHTAALSFLQNNHIVRGGMNPPKMHTAPAYMLSEGYEKTLNEWITGNKLAALAGAQVLSYHPTRGGLPLAELEIAAITGLGWLPKQVAEAVGVDLKISSDWDWEKKANLDFKYVSIGACLVGGVTTGKGGPGQVAGASYGGANTTASIYQKAKANRDSTVHSGFGSSERERTAQARVEQRAGWKFVTLGGETFSMAFPENPVYLQAHALPDN